MNPIFYPIWMERVLQFYVSIISWSKTNRSIVSDLYTMTVECIPSPCERHPDIVKLCPCSKTAYNAYAYMVLVEN